jgi:hypothetical protein
MVAPIKPRLPDLTAEVVVEGRMREVAPRMGLHAARHVNLGKTGNWFFDPNAPYDERERIGPQ